MSPWYRELTSLRLAPVAALVLVAGCSPLPPLDLAAAPLECLDGRWEIGEHEVPAPADSPHDVYDEVDDQGGLPAGVSTVVEETPERVVWHFHAGDRHLIGVVSVTFEENGWIVGSVTRCPLDEDRS